MKVLHVIPSISPRQGGPSNAIASMTRALAVRNCVVTIATTDNDGPGARFVSNGVPAVPGGTVQVFAQTSQTYTLALGALPWLWRNVPSFDVVHVHALFSFLPVFAALIARVRSVPYIVRPLGTLAQYGLNSRRPWLKRVSMTLIDRPVLNGARAVHCTSHAEAQEVVGVAPHARATVCPLAVDEPLFTLPRRELVDRPTVLFLSRIDPKKNLDVLLRAFAVVIAKDSRVRLHVAGAGADGYVESMRKLADELGIAPSVEWLGYVSGDTKLEALARASLFVLPSASENFGIAVAEALAAGVPCLVSAGVALSTDVVSAAAGELVSTEPAMLADAISAWLQADEKRAAASVAARALARERFSATALGANLLALYRDSRAA